LLHDYGFERLKENGFTGVSKGIRGISVVVTRDLQDGFSAGLVESPVCCLESCVLDTVSYREGKRRQWRLWRMSTDINVDVIVVSYYFFRDN
jgi:hypothetical protein